MRKRVAVKYQVAVLDGDGIGPEIVPTAVALADATTAQTGVSIEWQSLPIGWKAIGECGDPMPASTKEALAFTHGWIMGPHDSASYPADWHESRRAMPGGELRKHYQLYANIRPALTLAGVPAMVKDTDLIILRENTEGFYVDRNMFLGHGEIMPTSDVALAVGVFTRSAIERVVADGFALARSRRGHLTVAHKANALRTTTGMYKSIAEEMAPDYPDVTLDDYHVDAIAALLVRRPETFDVIVTENMFGDILSDLAGELCGGLGIGGALNAGKDHAMAQAVHGSAPNIAGQDVANPVAEMLSTLMLMRWMGIRHSDTGLQRAADLGETAIHETLASGVRTRDLGGEAGTREFSDAVLTHL
jgi:3-isopropylmalate dehydrogenase